MSDFAKNERQIERTKDRDWGRDAVWIEGNAMNVSFRGALARTLALNHVSFDSMLYRGTRTNTHFTPFATIWKIMSTDGCHCQHYFR